MIRLAHFNDAINLNPKKSFRKKSEPDDVKIGKPQIIKLSRDLQKKVDEVGNLLEKLNIER